MSVVRQAVVFASGLSVPEGPLLLPDESWLVVEMGADRGTVTHISADGRTRHTVARTGRPNGLALDAQGTIWGTETLHPALLRLTMDGEVEVFLTAADGEPFLFPNDLCFGPDGALYMTDSGMRVQEFEPGGRTRPDYATVPLDGRVYRVDVERRQARILDSGLRFANGIAFGPDRSLYVSETLAGAIHRYAWHPDGTVGPRQHFADVLEPGTPPGMKGPDGCKFGADGNLYVAVSGQSHVAVVGPAGEVIERISTQGRKPTNLAFGPPGQRAVYVAEDETGSLEMLEVGSDGLPLFYGGAAGQ